MSEIIIVAILLMPVLIVVFIMNRSQAKHKKQEQQKLSHYMTPLTEKCGISSSYQMLLVHQYVTLDERKRKLLVVNRKDFAFSHELLDIDEMKSITVQTIKQNLREEGKPKPEIFTAQIGIEISFRNDDQKRFLVFYTHLEQNVSQMADLEMEATAFCEKMKKLKAVKKPMADVEV